MATDEEVREARDRVEKLRAEIASNERARVEREREMANEITLAQLNAEAARLEVQLAQQKNTASDEAVRKGAQSPIAAAQADIERAELMQKSVADNLVPSEKGTVNQPTPTSPTSPISPVAPAPANKTTKGGN